MSFLKQFSLRYSMFILQYWLSRIATRVILCKLYTQFNSRCWNAMVQFLYILNRRFSESNWFQVSDNLLLILVHDMISLRNPELWKKRNKLLRFRCFEIVKQANYKMIYRLNFLSNAALHLRNLNVIFL